MNVIWGNATDPRKEAGSGFTVDRQGPDRGDEKLYSVPTAKASKLGLHGTGHDLQLSEV
jgi:hypothetical protein